ncbi:MAG: extracellular solute-binding protein [Clostridia bacterium]|nr:extracellular solute-binding protein [Clostridia bacterium]
MKKLRTLSLILATLTAASAVSCGDSQTVTPSGDTTASPSGDTTPAETEPAYAYPSLNMNGEKFTILNSTTTWGFYTSIHFDEATGEVLDDAIYDRNRFVEEKFNVDIDVVEENLDQAYKSLNSLIMAGDDVYQAAFLNSNSIASMITGGCFADLSQISTLQLDEPWWDQNVLRDAAIGQSGTIFVAATDVSLMGFDGTYCTFINEDMMADLNAQMPYELAREGSWTLDELHKLTKLGANLNGASDYTWDAAGSATYGLMSNATCPMVLLFGTGARLVANGEDGLPVYACENEHFYNAAEKIADLLSAEGEWLLLNSSGANHYEAAFKAGRCLVTIAELKASSKFREMDDNFGIVPIPKLDESQSEYYNYRTAVSSSFCIPVTSGDRESTGIIMDALSYLTYTDVMPIYYGVTVSQKGLRNDESIEMLGIIRDSRIFDIPNCYGWTEGIYGNIQSQLGGGDGAVASTVASGKQAVLQRIQSTLDLLEENS